MKTQPHAEGTRTRNVRRWPLFIIVACALLIVVSVVALGAFHRIEMSSESDGQHQDDHKVLGFIPYSTLRTAPELHVTDDAFHALYTAGVREDSEARRHDPFRPVARDFYPGKTVYLVQFDLGKRTARDVADYYAQQLVKPTRGHGPIFETVAGMCPDGQTRLELMAGGGIPAQLRFWRVAKASP